MSTSGKMSNGVENRQLHLVNSSELAIEAGVGTIIYHRQRVSGDGGNHSIRPQPIRKTSRDGVSG